MVSLPTWERGLKFNGVPPIKINKQVAPYMGAWIEIFGGDKMKTKKC